MVFGRESLRVAGIKYGRFALFLELDCARESTRGGTKNLARYTRGWT